jgi:hypothetical protein
VVRYSHRIKAIRYAAVTATTRFFPRRGGKFPQAQGAHRAPPRHKASDPTPPGLLQMPPPQTWMTALSLGMLLTAAASRRTPRAELSVMSSPRAGAGPVPPLGLASEPRRHLAPRRSRTYAATRPCAGAAPPLGPAPDHLRAGTASSCAEAANAPPESPVSPPLRPGKKTGEQDSCG